MSALLTIGACVGLVLWLWATFELIRFARRAIALIDEFNSFRAGR